MPLYSYRCAECQTKTAAFRKIIDRDEAPVCKCGEVTSRTLDAPRVFSDYAPYECPVTGRQIRGKREHQENLARHGCRVLEPGESEAFRRQKQHESEAEDEAFSETAAEIVATMPYAQRQRLEVELAQGADTTIARSTVTPSA